MPNWLQGRQLQCLSAMRFTCCAPGLPVLPVYVPCGFVDEIHSDHNSQLETLNVTMDNVRAHGSYIYLVKYNYVCVLFSLNNYCFFH